MGYPDIGAEPLKLYSTLTKYFFLEFGQWIQSELQAGGGDLIPWSAEKGRESWKDTLEKCSHLTNASLGMESRADPEQPGKLGEAGMSSGKQQGAGN